MKKIWRGLTFNITQAVYPLIPDLYQIFEDLATNQYISAKQIRQLSQNIYIIISAIMLFALGIKLISAIVNPDLLDDKKKGAKQTFFRCVAALFLIVLIPMGFNKMYDFQNTVAGKDENGNRNQLIEKILLGMDTSNSSNPGQILAAYGFASFCYPNETVSVESIKNNYNQALTEDISKIDNLDDAITSKTDGEWDLKYHPILSPAAGIFLVYEMIVLCMDIALRGIKLALLQLITPIILCAYVLTGNDVLQKYAKEVLSTFALLFLKIAMISFMIFGLSLLPGFLNSVSADGRGSFYTGILRVFIIIALFQLIKQLPDILNRMFGTNFKYRGGIRGRLGEMQGVGEMAQKAWDKIRNVGTKVGLLAASGPIGWAATGAAIGGGVAIKHGWNKGMFGSPAWKDTKGGRALRHVGGVTKGLWTGLSSSGGPVKGIKEGVKAYTDTEVAQSAAGSRDVARRDKIITGLKDSTTGFGIGADGRITDVVNATAASMGVGSDEEARTIAARNRQANIDSVVKTNLASAGASRYATDVQKLSAASRNKEYSAMAEASYNSIKDKVAALKANTSDKAIQSKLAYIEGQFLKNSYSAADVVREVDLAFGGTGLGSTGEASSINVDAKNLSELLKSDIYTFDNAGNVTGTVNLATALKVSATGGFNISDLKNETAAFAARYDSVKGDITSRMDKEKANDYQKLAVEKAIEYMDLTHKTTAETAKKWNN